MIKEIRLIYDNFAFETEILAASIRHTMHIVNCAKIGADVITGPLSSIKGLLNHPLTDIGLKKFLEDYKKETRGLLKLFQNQYRRNFQILHYKSFFVNAILLFKSVKTQRLCLLYQNLLMQIDH